MLHTPLKRARLPVPPHPHMREIFLVRGCQHRPILPGRLQPSIVGTGELNYRVRNGNGWTLTVNNTNFLFTAPSKPNRDECKSSRLIRLHKFLFRSSPRAISTGQLNVLPHLHFRPIDDVVFISSYSFRMGDLILGGVSRLDAFSVYLVQT